MPKQKVLLIANDFPPIGGAGVQRSLYFTKYLPNFGWQPIVLTVREVHFPAKDPTLLSELPSEVVILRTESFELRRLLWLALGLWRGRSPQGTSSAPTGSPPSTSRALNSRIRELGRTLKRWLFVPDDRMLWAPFAVATALRAIHREGISAVYATTPSYSSGVIGQIVSRWSGIPMVLDLRDPWTQDPYLPSPTRLHRWLNRKLEGSTLHHASRIVVIAETMRQHLFQAYPDIPETKVVTITNGFDARVLDAIPVQEPPAHFTMVYSGSLYAHHQSAFNAFCETWVLLAREDEDFRRGALLRLVGRCDPEILDDLARWRATGNLQAEALGYQTHEAALRHLKGASGLLLLIRDLDPQHEVVTIPGKLFEYLGTGVPILMLGPEGDAADIVRDCGSFVLRQQDSTQVARVLQTLFRRHRDATNLPPGSYELARDSDSSSALRERFDRKNLTRRLARELDYVAESRKAHLRE